MCNNMWNEVGFYEYVDSCYKFLMQELIYYRHFNSLSNHNIPTIDANGCVCDAQWSLIPFT